MTNNRYRLVTHQGGTEHVSSVVLSHAEALEALQVEEDMHQRAGWITRLYKDRLLCRHNATVRVLTIRESGPMEDTL